MAKIKTNKIIKILAAVLILSLIAALTAVFMAKNNNAYSPYGAVAPQNLPVGGFAPMPGFEGADYTVPADGSIEEVRDIIREKRKQAENAEKHYTVLIEDGEYNIKSIVFDGRDRDTAYRSKDGGAILNGGLRLDSKDFAAPADDVLSRLSSDAKANVKAVDLAKLGLAADDWGGMYAFGWSNTAGKYDGGTGPLPCELFIDGRRMTTARYPNGSEWLKTGEIIDGGNSSGDAEWPDMRNPRGGVFIMDEKTAGRAAKWTDTDDIWLFGCFRYDWADMSTRVRAFDHETGALTTEYASYYGFAEGANYYFYNILEELDEPGEWCLDRDKGILHLWPPAENLDNADIFLSLSTESLITGENIKNLSFIGLTLQGTRGNGMDLKGDGITVDHCLIQNVAGDAVSLDGYNNTASNNEIRRIGAKGITLDGGDAEALNPGGNRAVNNLIHDWSEIIMTYQGGINIYGTGNTAANNELYNSPHTAIFFWHGNNTVIEYNHIRDVCLLTDDAGAIYSGRSWFNAYGSVIRDNVIYNLGSGGHTPDGIYLDDGLTGVTVERNLLVNVPGRAIHVSGRDLEIHNNTVVNAGIPLSYDDRTRGGALDTKHWFHNLSGEGYQMWNDLLASPWQTEIWKTAYPKLALVSTDFNDIEEAAFAANPAGSSVTGNIFTGEKKAGFSDSVKRFSTTGPNGEYKLSKIKALFADAGAGDYGVPPGSDAYKKFPGWRNIEFDKVGRINF
ncbi:MAG: right-handed parallel beta-helix repeat-containing protein [Oscillospiraceae bacterium]|nr:right-handed parallel beta-helix repeat-containing protein [Oscillospiraceae bacterium]